VRLQVRVAVGARLPRDRVEGPRQDHDALDLLRGPGAPLLDEDGGRSQRQRADGLEHGAPVDVLGHPGPAPVVVVLGELHRLGLVKGCRELARHRRDALLERLAAAL
jgi:hypothetical protein